jgi:hypothetical protein
MTIPGALIMGLFATVWWVVGLKSAGHGAVLVYALPVVVTAGLGGIAWRLARRERAAPRAADAPAERTRRDRLVGWASAAEGLVIFLVAGIVLPSTGHRDATASAVALIVGAHFIPLARGLPAPAYYLTAAALIGLGLVGFGVADVGARVTLISAGAALVLWLTAVAVLHRHTQLRMSDLRSRAV